MKPFRVIPGMTARQVVEEANLEHNVVAHEARQHAAHLRLLAKQLPLWSDEQAARMLTRLADHYERKFTSDTAA